MKLSIIIPAYNEAEHIQDVIDVAMDSRSKIVEGTDFDAVEIILVNDGSTDHTAENMLRAAKKHLQQFRIENHEENQGYGAALKTGFAAASGDYLAFMDADGTIDPLSFIAMYEGLKKENADMVLGKRFGNDQSKMPLIRKLGNYFFATLLSWLSGEKVGDTASGVRLFKKAILSKLYPLPDGLHFTPAMSSKALHEKVKIVEVPIQYDVRSGKSKLSVVRDGYRFLRIIVGTVLLYNPFKVFASLGFLLILISLLLLAKPLLVLIEHRDLVFTDYIYRSIAALYLFVSGALVILFGIFSRFLVSTFFKLHETEEWIHRLNQKVQIYEKMMTYGFLVFSGGALINALYFIHYIIDRSLGLHWAWLLLAAGLIIVGLQMTITGLIMKIVKKIKQSMPRLEKE